MNKLSNIWITKMPVYKDDFNKYVEQPLVKFFGSSDEMGKSAKSFVESMFSLLETPIGGVKKVIEDGWLYTIWSMLVIIVLFRIGWKYAICPIYCFLIRTIFWGVRRGVTRFDDNYF